MNKSSIMISLSASFIQPELHRPVLVVGLFPFRDVADEISDGNETTTGRFDEIQAGSIVGF